MAQEKKSNAPSPAGTDASVGVGVGDTLLSDARGTAPSQAEHRAPKHLSTNDHDQLLGVDADHYVPGHELARGGMGRIVTARDRRLGRTVAIKELLRNDPDRVERFEREAFITARLQHPNIVPLYEAGRWDNGDPFYTMKLVAGRSLDDLLENEKLDVADRLALVPRLIPVVEAIAYAHSERVIHRDLKPANILLGDYGETVVIDWGLARHMDEPDDGATSVVAMAATLDSGSSPRLTTAGSVIGTPAYMPPEQAAGKEVDEHADVYSLGAILYHLLAGRAPYQGRTVERVLAQVAAGPPAPLTEIVESIPEDLATIIDKAMARAPEDRYATAQELAEELLRFRRGKLVSAHNYSVGQLVVRFLRRHRAGVVAAIAALAFSIGVGVYSIRSVVAERDRATEAHVEASDRADLLTIAQARTTLADDPLAALEQLRNLAPSASPAVQRSARLVAVEAQLLGLPRRFPGPEGGESIALSGDALIAHADYNDEAGTIRVWTPSASKNELRILGTHGSQVSMLAVEDGDQRLLSGGFDNAVRLWDIESGTSRLVGHHRGIVTRLQFLPGGKTAVSCALDEKIKAWDLYNGDETVISDEAGFGCTIALAPHDAAVAYVRETRKIYLWDATTGISRFIGDTAAVKQLAFSSDGKRLYSIGGDSVIREWSLTGKEPHLLLGHDSKLTHIAVAREGHLIATADENRVVRLWGPDRESHILTAPTAQIGDILFDTTGERLAISTAHGTQLWRVSSTPPELIRRHSSVTPGEADATGFLESGHYVGLSKELRAWPVAGGRKRLLKSKAPLASVSFSSDGGSVAIAELGDHTYTWDLDSEQLTTLKQPGTGAWLALTDPAGHGVVAIGTDRRARHFAPGAADPTRLPGRAILSAEFAPAGDILVAPGEDSDIRLWQLSSGESRVLKGHDAWVSGLRFVDGGRSLLSIAADGALRIWNMTDGTSRERWSADRILWHLAADRRGRWVATGGADGAILLGPATGDSAPVTVAKTDGIRDLAISPDGRRLAWVDKHGSLYWSRIDAPAAAGPPHTQPIQIEVASNISGVRFSPDGDWLLSRGGRLVQIWELSTQNSIDLSNHASDVVDAAFSPDGRHLVTATQGGDVWLWPLDIPRDATALRLWLDQILD